MAVNVAEAVRRVFSGIDAIESVYVTQDGSRLRILTIIDEDDEAVYPDIYTREKELRSALSGFPMRFNVSPVVAVAWRTFSAIAIRCGRDLHATNRATTSRTSRTSKPQRKTRHATNGGGRHRLYGLGDHRSLLRLRCITLTHSWQARISIHWIIMSGQRRSAPAARW